MRLFVTLTAITLASCVSPPPGSSMLDRELAQRVAGAPQQCISVFGTTNSLFVVDAHTIGYRSGSIIYLNHLSDRCPALSPFNTLITEVRGDQYCRGDHVKSIEPGAIIAGPGCNLGDWVSYRPR